MFKNNNDRQLYRYNNNKELTFEYHYIELKIHVNEQHLLM